MTSRLYTLTKPVRYFCRRDVRLSSSLSVQSRNPDELKNRTFSNQRVRALHVPASSFQPIPIQPRLTVHHSLSINQINWGLQFSSLTLQSTEEKDDKDDPITFDGVTARAKVKMNVLNDAKSIADKAKALYQSSKSSATELSPESLENIRRNWIEKEVELADAYSKGIKYIAKLRSKDVVRKAQLLLDDMISRHGTIQEQSTFLAGHDGPEFSDKIVFDLLLAIEEDTSRKSDALVCVAMRDGIPVPDMKDFSNVLHSWASSKVKRKGVYAESLLYRMMELGYFYPENFSMPDSKTFGLIIKCYAGSTFRDSLRSIQRLHKVHEKLADMNTPGIIKDDPFLLMHSIKSISNYTCLEETALVDDWFTRLHRNVMDKSNKTESNKHHAVSESEAKEAMDLTGTYTSVIRGYSKLRQDSGAAEKAFHALQRMQALSALDSEVATIDLKANLFNVVLGIAESSNDSKIRSKQLELLNSMIEGSRGSNGADCSTPMPTDQSFASCIKALSAITDPAATMNETEELMASFESLMKDGSIPPSPKPYNAAIELYLNMFGRDEDAPGSLLSICDDICKRMQNFTPSVHTDSFTSLALLKVCAYDDGIMDNQVQRMERAAQIFKDSSTSGDNEGSELNDKFYFYMMKCVANNVASAEDRKDQIKELFSKACSGGFVSANVLKMLRTQTSTEEYIAIVGSGRLADNWIENVTSGVAVYTDGTTGGEGKNARRKGKSTSNWAKKQREREETMLSRKQAKFEKKRLKTKREEKGKRRRP